ncbi:predicted protein [Thalassiosira pseudonana CCMP1335]|uniref:YCII-related domain-containing protein n=1 Tax=Thalassiosira pseudonana TaxID=35128 RepID=B8BUG5_THAPS|nr:predicted protein [Thalassiosira pseudonana CCMP1335]EED95285.1 predicted protein [Thalassiosira pseudonana CCMP1335]|eukprot:g10331.t1 g10331   contig4:1662274-1662952(+)
MKYRLSLATIAARLSVAPTSTAVAFTSNPAFTSSSATHVYRSPSFSVKRPTARTYARATSPLFSSPPTRYLLSYDYIPDVLEKRGPYREGHLGLAKQMLGDEVAVSGGPTLTPGESVPSGALFIFTTKEAAEKFVAEDPYVANGIVTGHSILEWTVVVGNN